MVSTALLSSGEFEGYVEFLADGDKEVEFFGRGEDSEGFGLATAVCFTLRL